MRSETREVKFRELLLLLRETGENTAYCSGCGHSPYCFLYFDLLFQVSEIQCLEPTQLEPSCCESQPMGMQTTCSSTAEGLEENREAESQVSLRRSQGLCASGQQARSTAGRVSKSGFWLGPRVHCVLYCSLSLTEENLSTNTQNLFSCLNMVIPLWLVKRKNWRNWGFSWTVIETKIPKAMLIISREFPKSVV